MSEIISIDTLEATDPRYFDNKFQISIRLDAWTFRRPCDKRDLTKIRDRINEILGYAQLSELFKIDIEQAEKIQEFHRRNERQCAECAFKLKECRDCVLVCQSPLERDLFLELKRTGINAELQKRVNKDGKCYDNTEAVDKENILTIPDFFIGTENKKLAIYADGHTYHERTEYQALRDRNIDRELQTLGFMVLRFTGKEIRDDLAGVVQNIRKNI